MMKPTFCVMHTGHRVCTLLFILILVTVTVLLAQPGQLLSGQDGTTSAAPSQTTLHYQGGPLPIESSFLPYLGTHYYDVFLQDYLLGRATIEVKKSGDEYQITVNAKTRSMLNALYKVRYRGEVTLHTNPLTPLSASIEETTGSKNKKYELQFEEAGRVTVNQMEQKGERPPQIKEKEYQSEKFVVDPFSTVYLIRSIDWHEGLTEIFDVVTGNKHYELLLTCSGASTVAMKDGSRTAWVIKPEARNLEKESTKKDQPNWSIYVSRDEMREILRIEGHPKIGRIVAQMRKFEKLF